MFPQIDSLKHSHKLEVTSIKLECARSKGELERDRDTLQDQMEGRISPPLQNRHQAILLRL